MRVEALESYLGGKWSRGQGAEIELVDPTNGSLLATVGASGVDLKAAVAFARCAVISLCTAPSVGRHSHE
jgi:oxepin-CoA hydrolase / 3-oxo-5,6-dehydrosuberyl-CoA semialdehyde dehydrogenase